MPWKRYLALLVLFLVLIFAVQNTQPVTIRFLLWSLSMSQVLMAFLLFGAGILFGALMDEIIRRRRRAD